METLKSILQYAIDRADEPSTWIGIGSMFTAIGWAINPETWQAISYIGMGVGGFAAMVLKEKT
ncbi:hypothetical protein UFOVP1349_37 [uncultured Caudovirales phage]|uniref:Uncharacterized protein n=1 Tax=uncultured Caudovirales phage TaxID=2100421 RepID=A0A6J5PR02_9CAUD|nr:hypothetical protein UFOVP925_6 [uncultured Caudovirales phage]CAB4184290.1 hypothetical protein UFOVP1097_43 [uncultured Caudovirales phage]CAB4200281.1 hypothetical protein UFOVP1349_37 [uncultured Caudovirales phage]CAB4214130.1 hypothetical protein UFOVP1456_17 [uncultured Caudovirales phage]